jgi:hypothetical protein
MQLNNLEMNETPVNTVADRLAFLRRWRLDDNSFLLERCDYAGFNGRPIDDCGQRRCCLAWQKSSQRSSITARISAIFSQIGCF